MTHNAVKPFLLLFILVSSSLSQANSSFSSTTISGVVVHDFGNEIIIELANSVSNGEDCSINSSFVLLKSHPSFDQMYAAILSAFHAGTKIEGWVNGCHSWSMPILTRLDLKK